MAIAIFDVSGTLHEDYLGAPMYDEFYDLFDYLIKNNVQIALATNLSRSGLDHFMKNNNLKSKVSEHICLSEAAPKPNPEMLQEILLRTGENAGNALMVGDAASDISMAKSLSVKSCAVNWKGGWSPSVLSLNPDYKVENITELWQIFDNVFHLKR